MLNEIFIKITSIISIIAVSIMGVLGFIPEDRFDQLQRDISQLENKIQEQSFGAIYPVAPASDCCKLSGSGIGTTDTSIILQSLKTRDGREISMTNFGATGYATLEPGGSSKEFVSFTGVTQDGNSDKATLTGVSRGLDFIYPYAASSTLAKSHSGGSKAIISNLPSLYGEYASKSNAETISAIWTFNSSTIPRLDGYLAPTNDAQFAPKKYADDLTASGVADGSYSTFGGFVLATGSQMIIGTATSTATRYLVAPSALFGATSSAKNMGVMTNSSGKISQGFLDLTQGFSFSGGVTSTGLSVFASTTINNTLSVTGTSTFTGTTTFAKIPTIATSTSLQIDQVVSQFTLNNVFNTTTAPSRAENTSYQNTSGKSRLVTITATCMEYAGTAGGYAQYQAFMGAATDTTLVSAFKVDTADAATFNVTVSGNMLFIVPNNYYYKIQETAVGGTSNCAVAYWGESTTY